ncbi:MAG: flagellar basal-body rod protein FlgB [Bdellovibrionales bacterium RIFOXYD12_FULL_39_22]|nr:MAG: flagellar basal-body rod protein FlgB [Bdellovibrionales bacterium RIFOXYB1_FULL_39_21]OFZ42127.1 MAG: flagellar basal-body rod protein FlgB [Bdellovibrionales bacterium RIFOXYC12_FULL_39_17]OFZ50843.1 MAG: flagellar basal-body rod protein FlgB [Bdellovibrionales bacterium RIFOXYC1_FULL_39_130]OFZ78066.1 MAG: flagellar basal-body rod protein FlgB [Bdellovibrionales bacterium RIFOXYD1_FULL_39_84]OFZ93497.1 MAG: flagellar basal-body rod protein FlgB [Bdellovibrionales bacterium RIFOXYD12_
MQVDDKTVQALAAALNFRQMRQELIASNIANADTPGYKAKRLDFEEALARALDVDGQENMLATDDRHYDVGNGGFSNMQPEIYDDPNGIVSLDGNNVDRDQELARMSENRIMYEATVALLNKKLGLMKYAITSER